jgi:hypothetical protein
MKDAGNLPVILRQEDTLNPDSALQLATTEISPANHLEDSRKQSQRTGLQKNSAGNLLPEILVFHALNTDSALQLARTEMSPVNHSEHSRKHR